jgi:hypothetical protein
MQELQVGEFAERFLDLKKRTTLAHFYRTYQAALANPLQVALYSCDHGPWHLRDMTLDCLQHVKC